MDMYEKEAVQSELKVLNRMWIGAVIVCLLLLAGWMTHSFFEARAFNAHRESGSPATTWQAMWVELRVMSD